MTLALETKWIWDSWYVHDGAQWHAFFLQADKSLLDPDLRHWNVTQGHAVGQDLRNWTHLGTMFAPSASPAWDDFTTWTGSVVRGDDDQWHLFYTGTSRADNGKKQRIGHAVSDDLHQWQRVDSGVGPGVGSGVNPGLALDIDARYEEYAPGHWHDRACRDPLVIRDPDGAGWLMYFTGRAPDIAEPNAGGVIGLATSPDLLHWTLQAPVYTGGMFGQLEVPQVFTRDGRWYCLFCVAAEHWSAAYRQSYPGAPVTGTHYLISDNPRGPWQVAPGPFLDGATPCYRYAARIVEDQGTLKLLGFLCNPGGGPFVGEISDPVEVLIGDDGLLRLAATATTTA